MEHKADKEFRQIRQVAWGRMADGCIVMQIEDDEPIILNPSQADEFSLGLQATINWDKKPE